MVAKTTPFALRPRPFERKPPSCHPGAEVFPVLPVKGRPEKEQGWSVIKGHDIGRCEVGLATDLFKKAP